VRGAWCSQQCITRQITRGCFPDNCRGSEQGCLAVEEMGAWRGAPAMALHLSDDQQLFGAQAESPSAPSHAPWPRCPLKTLLDSQQ
jgi:hypothetical protein